ncbi:MAG: hypothetical protein IKU75_01785 [Butyricimonas sp.]|nr:hypothetical protein [Butyricimonas sp.]
MTNKEIEEFVDILYPFFLKKMRNDGYFKNNVKMKNATVVKSTSAGGNVEIRLPYDTTSFSVRNETGKSLNQGDLVCIMYWVDLKNAVAMFKV